MRKPFWKIGLNATAMLFVGLFLPAPAPALEPLDTIPLPILSTCPDLLVRRSDRVGMVPGLYASIPASGDFVAGDLRFTTRPSIFTIPNGHNQTTVVTYTHAGVSIEGVVSRMILNRGGQRVLIFESADLNATVERPATSQPGLPPNARVQGETEIWNIPTRVRAEDVVPLTPEGIPVQALATLIQMRIAGVPFGGLHSAEMRQVVNSRMSLELAILVRDWRTRNPGQGVTTQVLNQLILQTHPVQYARTVLEQSGHRIVSAEITDSSTMPFSRLRLSGRDQGDPYIQRVLREGGFQADETLYSGLDIRLNLEPISTP